MYTMELSTIPMESLAQLLQLQMDRGGIARLVVTGSSMYPTLRHRKDAVVLCELSRALQKGDLILYKRENGQYILHRIVSKPNGGKFICSGDNQWEPEQVKQEQVLALVTTLIRDGKYIGVDSMPCRLWVGIWVALFPVRKPLIRLRRLLGRLRKKLKI